MITLRRLLFLGALLAVAGCGNRERPDAERMLRNIGAPALRQEAARFYKELFVAPTGRYFLPKPDQWPPAFRRFQPDQVRAYADGFSLALSNARGVEEGLYIIPTGMDRTPSDGPNARYQRIDEGIYWYWFKE